MSTKKPCPCCGESCKRFDFNSISDDGKTLADFFDVVSGSWNLLSTNGINESTGSGIALAKGATFTGFEQLVLTADSQAGYDLIFDYIDADNYKACQYYETTAPNYAPRITSVVAGVETPYTLYGPTPSSAAASTANMLWLDLNATSLWTLMAFDSGVYRPARYHNETLSGGTRFGIRSRTGGSTTNRVRNFLACSTVDYDLAGAVADDVTENGAIHVPSDPNGEFCAVSRSTIRCPDCIHWGTMNEDETWMLTIAGVTGSCAGLFNRSVALAYNPSWYGTFSCTRTHLTTDTCWDGSQNVKAHFHSDFGSFPNSGGALLSQSLIEAYTFGSGFTRLLGLDPPGGVPVNPYDCFNRDFSGPLSVSFKAAPTSYLNFDSATASLSVT